MIKATAVEVSIHIFSPNVSGSKPTWTIVTGSCVISSSSNASGSSACEAAAPAWYMPRARARLCASRGDNGGGKEGVDTLLSSVMKTRRNTQPMSWLGQCWLLEEGASIEAAVQVEEDMATPSQDLENPVNSSRHACRIYRAVHMAYLGCGLWCNQTSPFGLLRLLAHEPGVLLGKAGTHAL